MGLFWQGRDGIDDDDIFNKGRVVGGGNLQGGIGVADGIDKLKSELSTGKALVFFQHGMQAHVVGG